MGDALDALPMSYCSGGQFSGTATPADLLEFSPTATQRLAKGQATPSSPTPPVPGIVRTLWPLKMAPVAGLRATTTPDPVESCPTARHRVFDAHATPDMKMPEMVWSSDHCVPLPYRG